MHMHTFIMCMCVTFIIKLGVNLEKYSTTSSSSCIWYVSVNNLVPWRDIGDVR